MTAGGGPANYHGSAWQVHFAVTAPQEAQGQYVVLSVALVAQDASLVVTLNGHSETWSYNNFAPDDPSGPQRRRRFLSVGGVSVSHYRI